MSGLTIVTLKNGSTEPLSAVVVLTTILEDLFTNKPTVAYELVMICRDRTHTIWGSIAGQLRDLALLQADGRVHDSIRNIVLSSVEGDGMRMTLVNPIKS